MYIYRRIEIAESEKKEETKTTPLGAWDTYYRKWAKIFLFSCVVGLIIDPLFLYIHTIDDTNKCVVMDGSIKSAAVTLRSLTDLMYLVHIIVRIQSAFSTAKELDLSLWTGFPWFTLLIDVLAILPLPQVYIYLMFFLLYILYNFILTYMYMYIQFIIVAYFPKIVRSGNWKARKVLNLLLLLQYVPRIMRVHLSCKDLVGALDGLAHRVWARVFFYFCLYLISGHVS